MKRTLFIISLLTILLTSGCQTSTLQMGSSVIKRSSLAYPLKLDGLTITTTTITNGVVVGQNQIVLKGYVSDQAQMAEAIATGVAKGLASGVK